MVVTAGDRVVTKRARSFAPGLRRFLLKPTKLARVASAIQRCRTRVCRRPVVDCGELATLAVRNDIRASELGDCGTARHVLGAQCPRRVWRQLAIFLYHRSPRTCSRARVATALRQPIVLAWLRSECGEFLVREKCLGFFARATASVASVTSEEVTSPCKSWSSVARSLDRRLAFDESERVWRVSGPP